ncbi:MAG: hypothetical protein QME58_06590 [Bacteroidota bacterium]|nr:hypothetical protein [Bacteroidota bacterium]
MKNLKPQIQAIFRCFASLNMTKSQFCVTSVIYQLNEKLAEGNSTKDESASYCNWREGW